MALITAMGRQPREERRRKKQRVEQSRSEKTTKLEVLSLQCKTSYCSQHNICLQHSKGWFESRYTIFCCESHASQILHKLYIDTGKTHNLQEGLELNKGEALKRSAVEDAEDAIEGAVEEALNVAVQVAYSINWLTNPTKKQA